jgi:hypothetical protein
MLALPAEAWRFVSPLRECAGADIGVGDAI